MQCYPVCLVHMERRIAIVVGGGKVAERKVAGLLKAGAQVIVISPAQTEQLLAWAQAGAVRLISRAYRRGDLAGAFLAIVATDDPAVNQAICDEALACGCLVNSAEQPERSDFILPVISEQGAITVAISTGGASPALARHLRERVSQVIGREYANAAALLAELRPILIEWFPDHATRSAAVEQWLESSLAADCAEAGGAARSQALEFLDAIRVKAARRNGASEQPSAAQNASQNGGRVP